QLVTLEDIEETVFSSDDQSPEQIALRFEQLSEVSDAIRNLPRLQKQVLRLRYGSDLSIAEIGQLLKKREPAVRQLLSRAISFLRSACHFQEKEGETAR
ncbi:MAG TPA: sigma-70 family RNA polymerase sigma factor, partial [Ktedonobacteraceae bacterium]|nr:sigma-70 family RNA polymerase sigma factor [Ktedonobacteraceae bacterium]